VGAHGTRGGPRHGGSLRISQKIYMPQNDILYRSNISAFHQQQQVVLDGKLDPNMNRRHN
jgi:hypothetical protein